METVLFHGKVEKVDVCSHSLEEAASLGLVEIVSTSLDS